MSNYIQSFAKNLFLAIHVFTFSFIFSFLRVVWLWFFYRHIPWCLESVSDTFNMYWKWVFTIQDQVYWPKNWKSHIFRDAPKSALKRFLSDKFTFSLQTTPELWKIIFNTNWRYLPILSSSLSSVKKVILSSSRSSGIGRVNKKTSEVFTSKTLPLFIKSFIWEETGKM